jgi:hypothetical protein
MSSRPAATIALPGALVRGIEAADPMIAARSAAYIVSLSRRAQGQ